MRTTALLLLLLAACGGSGSQPYDPFMTQPHEGVSTLVVRNYALSPITEIWFDHDQGVTVLSVYIEAGEEFRRPIPVREFWFAVKLEDGRITAIHELHHSTIRIIRQMPGTPEEDPPIPTPTVVSGFSIHDEACETPGMPLRTVAEDMWCWYWGEYCEEDS